MGDRRPELAETEEADLVFRECLVHDRVLEEYHRPTATATGLEHEVYPRSPRAREWKSLQSTSTIVHCLPVAMGGVCDSRIASMACTVALGRRRPLSFREDAGPHLPAGRPVERSPPPSSGRAAYRAAATACS